MQLSPERKLLLSCTRMHLCRDELQYLEHELVSVGINWNYITAIAYQHGIAPLIYCNLRLNKPDNSLSKSSMDALKRSYYSNSVRNELLYKELNKILSALQDMGIKVIVLKGAALAEIVYRNRALRPMSDVDLLVRKEDLSWVEDKLVEMAYQLYEHHRSREWLKEHYYHLVFIKNDTTPIEIHWHIDRPSRPFTIDIEGMWKRAVPANIAGVEALVLSPEDLLLHLCLHTCKHKLTGGLRPFCDIAATVRHYGPHIDWGQIQARSQQWRVTPYVYLPLYLAKDLAGAAVPEPVLDALRPDGFDARLVDWAREEIFELKGTSPISPELLHLWKGRGLKDQLAVLVKSLSPKVIAKHYAVSPASKKLYFYYPARLKHLLMRYGPVLWRLWCRDQQLRALTEEKSQLAEWLALGWNEHQDERAPPSSPRVQTGARPRTSAFQ
jgi:hypothetical protein